MSHNTDTETIISENKSINSEIEILHRMLSEKDNLLININSKLLNMEDQMKRLTQQNNNLESYMYQMMDMLTRFSNETKRELTAIKYNSNTHC
jgi:type VI protein secretion system component VasF